jgi:hypothetical protein
MRNYESKLVDSSRLIADILVNDIGQDQERFLEMLELTFLDKYPLSMRAARIVALCTEKSPSLITSHIPTLLNKLSGLKVEGVRRGLLKILADNTLELDEEQTGLLTDMAFSWLEDTKEAIAIRYYSMEIILQVCRKYPELKKELFFLLKTFVNEDSPGISSKSKAILKELGKSKDFETG